MANRNLTPTVVEPRSEVVSIPPHWGEFGVAIHDPSVSIPDPSDLLTGRSEVWASQTKKGSPRAVALCDVWEFDFIQPNRDGVWLLDFDLDTPDACRRALDPIFPRWDYVVETGPGRWHVGYVLRKPITAGENPAPLRLAHAFERNVRELLWADAHARSAAKFRNPFSAFARVWWSETPASRSLGELVECLRAAGEWTPEALEPCPEDARRVALAALNDPTRGGKSSRPTAAPARWPMGTRNERLFEHTRWAAYAGADAYEVAATLNERHCDPPLPVSEVREVAASITGWVREKYVPGSGGAKLSPEALEVCRELGRIGGSQNSEKQQTQRREKAAPSMQAALRGRTAARATWAQGLRAEGLTQAQIAVEMGVSERSVRRWLAAGDNRSNLELSGGCMHPTHTTPTLPHPEPPSQPTPSPTAQTPSPSLAEPLAPAYAPAPSPSPSVTRLCVSAGSSQRPSDLPPALSS